MMNKHLKQFQFNVVITTTIIGLAAITYADDADKMPTATSVIKKYADASGGVDKFKALKSLKISGKILIAAMGIEGPLESIQVMPDKVTSKVEMPQVGMQAQGTNGEIGWELSTMMGPRLLEGKEFTQLRDEANYQKVYDPEKFYKELKVVGMEEVNGDKCYKLKLTKKNDSTSIEYYSLKTGLAVMSENTVQTQMGDMKIKVFFSEYKDVDGLKLPFKVENKFSNGISQVIELEKIEINPKIDDSAFDIPVEVKTLMGDDDDEDDEDEK